MNNNFYLNVKKSSKIIIPSLIIILIISVASTLMYNTFSKNKHYKSMLDNINKANLISGKVANINTQLSSILFGSEKVENTTYHKDLTEINTAAKYILQSDSNSKDSMLIVYQINRLLKVLDENVSLSEKSIKENNKSETIKYLQNIGYLAGFVRDYSQQYILLEIKNAGNIKKKNNDETANDLNIDSSSKKINLILADSQTSDYPSVYGDREFARLVSERTNGRIEINIITNGKLGSEKDAIEQAKIGTIDFTRTSVAPLSSLNILTLPFLFKSSEHMWNVLDGTIGNTLLNNLGSSDITGLCFFASGSRSFYNDKTEIKSLQDLKGLRIRVPENDLMKDFVNCLGATAITMDANKVLDNLTLGQLDGAENNPTSYITFNHYLIAKYITLDEHSTPPEIIVASSKTMSKLSKEDQQIIKESAKDASKLQKIQWQKVETAALNKMQEAGCKITKLNDTALEEFKNASIPIYNKYAASPEDKELISSIKNTK